MRKNLLYLLAILVGSSFTLNAQSLINDDFEGYILGAVGPQASHWTTWTPGLASEEGEVSDDIAYSGSKSLKVYGQGGPIDCVLQLGNQTSGHFRLEFKMYVVGGQAAYFNHQKDQTALGSFWGQEVYMNNNGTGTIDAGAADAASFTFAQDKWITVVQFFDLDNDRTSLIIDNEFVHSWPFNESSQGTSNGTIQLGAIDFYGRSDAYHLFYLDDVKFTQLPSLANTGAIIKLKVDMEKWLNDGNTISSDGMYVAGTFNNWTPDSTQLMDNGDSTYSQFIAIEQFTTAEYKFINGNTFSGEEVVPMDCGVDNGQGGYNRELGIFFTDSAAATVCFSYCTACDLTINTDEVAFETAVNIYPNPAFDQAFVAYSFEQQTDLSIRVLNSVGQVVREQLLTNVTQGIEPIDVSSLSAGIYFIQLGDALHQTTKKIVIGK